VDTVIAELDKHGGAVVAVATLASVALTLLLLLEARTTRNLRREAAVEAHPRLYGPGGMLVELILQNHGPAIARDVAIAFHFTDADGANQGGRQQREPLLAVGDDRRFLPSPGEGLPTLNELAESDLSLHVSWSWNDDRRRLWFFPTRHSRTEAYCAVALRDGFYGGWSLTRRDPEGDLHEVAEKLKAIEGHMRHLRAIESNTKNLRALVRDLGGPGVTTVDSKAPEPRRDAWPQRLLALVALKLGLGRRR
jgi:hypothetical protein